MKNGLCASTGGGPGLLVDDEISRRHWDESPNRRSVADRMAAGCCSTCRHFGTPPPAYVGGTVGDDAYCGALGCVMGSDHGGPVLCAEYEERALPSSVPTIDARLDELNLEPTEAGDAYRYYRAILARGALGYASALRRLRALTCPCSYGEIRAALDLQLVNLTPHEITMLADDGELVEGRHPIDPAGRVARCEEIHEDAGYVAGYRAVRVTYGPVRIERPNPDGPIPITEPMPDEAPGTIYVVSGRVRDMCPGRHDLTCPVEQVRGEGGSVLGCRALAAVDTRTIAERISALLLDDGQQWESADGRTLDALCRAGLAQRGAEPDYRDGRGTDTYRYDFPDGSCITVAGQGWDLGYPGCFCWRGDGHSEECMRLTAESEGDDDDE